MKQRNLLVCFGPARLLLCGRGCLQQKQKRRNKNKHSQLTCGPRMKKKKKYYLLAGFGPVGPSRLLLCSRGCLKLNQKRRKRVLGQLVSWQRMKQETYKVALVRWGCWCPQLKQKKKNGHQEYWPRIKPSLQVVALGQERQPQQEKNWL